MKSRIRAWLEDGRVDVFLGYKTIDGHPLPFVFTKENVAELSELAVSLSRYPLEKLAADILAEQPRIKIGLLARECDKRALHVLRIANQIPEQNLITIDVSCCASKPKEQPDCSSLKFTEAGNYKREVGIDRNLTPEDIRGYPQEERFKRWMYEFQKCIRCYGCRNICPVCFCRECSLENPDLIEKGPLPPEVPLFHLTRAVHMAGRCVDCGLCEEACPVDIPLRLLYREVGRIMNDLFDYDSGVSSAIPPFASYESSNGAGPSSNQGE